MSQSVSGIDPGKPGVTANRNIGAFSAIKIPFALYPTDNKK